jgi:hypothetical protein
MYVYMSLNDEAFGTDGAVVLALVPEIERHETEPPLALYVHGLHHPLAVRTRPRRPCVDTTLSSSSQTKTRHIDPLLFLSFCLCPTCADNLELGKSDFGR